MSWMTRLFGRDRTAAGRRGYGDPAEEQFADALGIVSASQTGIPVNQHTALNAAAVLACVTMISEDVGKLTPEIYRQREDGGREVAKDHFLHTLLDEPNEWQSGMEFREQLTGGLMMRGNGYAAILRDRRGVPSQLVPWNPDRVALWETPDGGLFYRLSASGMHEMAMAARFPTLVPAEDMIHLRGFSLNGLLGAARISLAREAIGLSLAQEQLAARWMGNSARPSGLLTTDKTLTPEGAQRMSEDWKKKHAGLANTGSIPVLEQGLKWQAMSLSSLDMEFIAARAFQLQEVCRIFRVPPHMVGELSRSTNNNIGQQGQEYVNYTLSGYTNRWRSKLSSQFGLKRQGLFIDFDYREITRGDVAARYNAYRTGIMSMFMTPNEARIDDGRDPMEGGDKLQQPQNMAAAGSQSTGTAPDDAGRPAADASAA
ncbi:phage portal protein [Lichenihabitans psoromatis]|uniref:phage portal protein n=1 Tax=Lichenihabitans psoromatis TaxID=2528642 RepID=UPI001035EF88|nr:phage portal protein [Lichenihabitans psoromatis]